MDVAQADGAPAEIVACVTCGGAASAPDGRTRGEHLLERLQAEAAGRGPGAPRISPVKCLWACQESRSVLRRSERRVGYVIASREPSEEVARALLDYAESYTRTSDGAVPFRTWPPALKG